MTYREPLPDDCPPEEADEITQERIFYRLVRTDPPTNNDFRSQRYERPNAVFHSVPGGECQARGLSVFLRRRDAERQLLKGRLCGMLLCAVTLNQGAGRIHRWHRRGSHYTWWPRAEFDILVNCEVVAI